MSMSKQDAAKGFLRAHDQWVKTAKKLQRARKIFLKVTRIDEKILNVYHVGRRCLEPDEIALKLYKVWNAVTERVVSIPKLRRMMKLHDPDTAKDFAKIVWVHEVRIIK